MLTPAYEMTSPTTVGRRRYYGYVRPTADGRIVHGTFVALMVLLPK